jgi:DinB superfamily
MTKTEIASLLSENHKQFIRSFESLNEFEFLSSVNDKWNASQQLDHIIRAVQPVVLAFTLPSFALKLFFGKANRSSRSYTELVEKYKNKLTAGGRASGRFVPTGLSYSQKNSSLKKLTQLVSSLNKKLEKKSEEDLDLFILPHPLLGKITLREMLYFTAYHAEHHKNQVVKNLETLIQA